MDRTNTAISDATDCHIELDWNADTSKYLIFFQEKPKSTTKKVSESGDALSTYTPPQSDKLFDIKSVKISPISLIVSFRRAPQASRYNNKGPKIVTYALKKLKFTLDKAPLYFAGYITTNVKGPPDRIIEIIQAVYVSRVKSQCLKIVTCTSFVEWKEMTDRAGGGDEYMEGDVLRLTGTMLGVVSGSVLKGATHGIGEGLILVTSNVGSGIQQATEFVGVGVVGSGINTAVSGLGGGVGASVKTVGTNADSALKSLGKGTGRVLGGLQGFIERPFMTKKK